MSTATRLLVLGAIRIMQPVYGYDVRRELVSWRIGEVSNVKPGSVYGAIRTLGKDGCLAVHSRDSADSRPERTKYVTTGEGEISCSPGPAASSSGPASCSNGSRTFSRQSA